MPVNIERRCERRYAAGLQLRELEKHQDGRIATLSGYGAVFGTLSEDLGGFREFIRKGAFSESLKRGDDVRAMGHHTTVQIIGRRSAKTLDIAEDDKGLKVDISVPDTSYGRDLIVSVKRGDLTGMSFGFNTIDDTWTKETKDGVAVLRRELIAVDLFEVSVVAFPAYTDTSVEARGDVRALTDILADGKRRVGKDAPADARSRRDRLISAYRTRVALWTGK
ncbi:MAG: HK97 family phage prohead protease [Phycisphaerales bacterium]